MAKKYWTIAKRRERLAQAAAAAPNSGGPRPGEVWEPLGARRNCERWGIPLERDQVEVLEVEDGQVVVRSRAGGRRSRQLLDRFVAKNYCVVAKRGDGAA